MWLFRQGRFAFHNYTIRRLYRQEIKSKGSWAKHASRRRTPLPSKPVAAEEKLNEDIDLPNPPFEVPVENLKNSTPSERLMAYWLENPDPADKLSASHFRRILECSCGGLESFGGVHFIRISITGESFMVHQVSTSRSPEVFSQPSWQAAVVSFICFHTENIHDWNMQVFSLFWPDGIDLVNSNRFYTICLVQVFASWALQSNQRDILNLLLVNLK